MDARPSHLQPVWIAALLAYTRSSGSDSAVKCRVRWRSGRAALRFTNGGADPVFVAALGLELRSGHSVDVRWPAGATGFEVTVMFTNVT